MYVYDFSMGSDTLQLYICGTEMLSNMFVISLWAVKDYNYICGTEILSAYEK